MNDELCKRAWAKAEKEPLYTRDHIRGAICYYRGFQHKRFEGNAQSYADGFERAIKDYVHSGSLLEIDKAMATYMSRYRIFPKPIETIPDAQSDDEHWSEITHDFSSWKPDEKIVEMVSRPKLTEVDARSVVTNTIRMHEHLDKETLDRLRVIYDSLDGVWKRSYEEFVEGFYCDLNPYGEIRIWERIALTCNLTFKRFNNSLDDKQKMMIYWCLLMFSAGKMDYQGLPKDIWLTMGHFWMMDSKGLSMKKQIEDKFGKIPLSDKLWWLA